MKTSYREALKSLEVVERLADCAFTQATEMIYKKHNVLVREEVEKIHDRYMEIERAYRQTICVGQAELERLVAVFILSVYLCSDLAKLDGEGG